MGITERKLRHREEVRSSILKAAWQLVLDEGWQALSIRKIADAIEYSAPVIYDHFQNKEAILLELTRQGFQILNRELDQALQQSTEPATQLEAMAFAYWNFALNHKAYYQVMYGLGMPSCEMVGQIPELGAFISRISGPIKSMIASGSAPETDSFLKVHTFWSLLHGLISINMINAHKEKLNRMILQDFIKGFISGMNR